MKTQEIIDAIHVLNESIVLNSELTSPEGRGVIKLANQKIEKLIKLL